MDWAKISTSAVIEGYLAVQSASQQQGTRRCFDLRSDVPPVPGSPHLVKALPLLHLPWWSAVCEFTYCLEGTQQEYNNILAAAWVACCLRRLHSYVHSLIFVWSLAKDIVLELCTFARRESKTKRSTISITPLSWSAPLISHLCNNKNKQQQQQQHQ